MKKIGEIAQQTNRSPRALRLYEERGLLIPSQRSVGGFRLYGEEQVLQVEYIDKLQELGCSLSDIQSLIDSWRSQSTAHEGMQELEVAYQQKYLEVCAAIEKLERVKYELTESLIFLEGCHTCSTTTSPQDTCYQCTRPERQNLTLIRGISSQTRSEEP